MELEPQSLSVSQYPIFLLFSSFLFFSFLLYSYFSTLLSFFPFLFSSLLFSPLLFSYSSYFAFSSFSTLSSPLFFCHGILSYLYPISLHQRLTSPFSVSSLDISNLCPSSSPCSLSSLLFFFFFSYSFLFFSLCFFFFFDFLYSFLLPSPTLFSNSTPSLPLLLFYSPLILSLYPLLLFSSASSFSILFHHYMYLYPSSFFLI